MKRIIQAAVVAALLTGAQASLADAFPGNGDPVVLPSLSTYADRHAGEIAMGGSNNPFPGNGDPVELAAEWTHADRNAAAIAAAPSSDPFPGNGDPVVLAPMSTYADQYITERSKLASGASDAAASE
jgi:hypothetical protein